MSDIDQDIHKGKMKVALNEKRKKLHGFSFSINIANFEAFLLVFKLTKNLFFLKSANGSRIYLLVLHFVKYGDRYITSQILMENHLAGCFEYFDFL